MKKIPADDDRIVCTAGSVVLSRIASGDVFSDFCPEQVIWQATMDMIIKKCGFNTII
jgi:hypothetical protein